MSDSLARARGLVRQRDFPAAEQVLRDVLTLARQDPADADEYEAETAVLYAGVLLQLSEPHTARTWATYAHSAMRRLNGERDRRTLHALGVLAVSEHRAGALDRATRHYQQLITALSAVDGPDADRTLAARADATFVDHARGVCTSARSQLAEVIAVHAGIHGPAHPVGIRMIARLAGMWRDCGDFDRAHQLLTRARAQAAAVPTDDEIHRILNAAARASADQHHHCGVEHTRPGTGGQPGVFPVLLVPEPEDFIPPSRMVAHTPQVTEWPEDDVIDPPPTRQAHSYPPPSAQPAPPSRSSANGPPLSYSAPDRYPPSHMPADVPPWSHSAPGRYPPSRLPADVPPLSDPAPDRFAPPPTDRHAPAYSPAQTPPVMFTPPQQALVPDTRPVMRPPPRTPLRPPHRASRGRVLAVAAVSLLAVVAIALVAVAILLTGKENSPSVTATPGTPTGSAVPIVVPAGPVGNLKLTDQGDRLLITWIYPANARGPIIVSAAKAGEPMRPLQSLPAGTESLTLPGLDPQRDYCVTVTVAYSAENMVMAPAVCTDRKRASPVQSLG